MKNIVRENQKYIFYEDCIYSKQCYKYLQVRDSKKYGKHSIHKWLDEYDVLFIKNKYTALYIYNI